MKVTFEVDTKLYKKWKTHLVNYDGPEDAITRHMMYDVHNANPELYGGLIEMCWYMNQNDSEYIGSEELDFEGCIEDIKRHIEVTLNSKVLETVNELLDWRPDVEEITAGLKRYLNGQDTRKKKTKIWKAILLKKE